MINPLDIVGAIKSLGKIVDFVKWGLIGIGAGIKKLARKLKLNKLLKKKKEIDDAKTPSDWTNILNS